MMEVLVRVGDIMRYGLAEAVERARWKDALALSLSFPTGCNTTPLREAVASTYVSFNEAADGLYRLATIGCNMAPPDAGREHEDQITEFSYDPAYEDWGDVHTPKAD